MALERRQKIIVALYIFVALAFVVSIILGANLPKKFREARNLTRKRHIQMIFEAVYAYYVLYNKFPDCIPQSGEPIEVKKCGEIKPFLTSFPSDPLSDKDYFIQYFDKEKTKIRIFSNAPEAKGIEIIR